VGRVPSLALLAAAAGGLTLSAAFPPLSTPWLAPVGVALLFAAVGSRPAVGAMVGAVFGSVFVGTTCWWLAESTAAAAWLAVTVSQALWFALLGSAAALLRNLPGWPLWAGCTWSVVEAVRTSWPWGGLPWGRLGYTAVDTPWSAALSVVGVTATGTLIASAGAVLASAFVDARVASRSGARAGRLVAIWAAGLGVVSTVPVAGIAIGSWSTPATPASIARIAMVQAEVPGTGTDVASHHRKITDTLLDETRASAASWAASGVVPELVVWPENATAVDPADDDQARSLLLTATRTAGAPLLAGSIVDDTPTTARNEAILWTTDGPGPRYTKQHLVPFGEYVPLRAVAERLSARVADIERDMVPGPPAAPMSVGELRVANALCFDVAYDSVIRHQVAQGANVVVVQTSNAMFLGTAQQEQQWAITRSRAIEVGRSVVVSSMNGITGAVSYDGSVLDRLPDTVSGSTVVDVPITARVTPATTLGPWPSRLVWAIAALGFALVARRRTPRRHGVPSPTYYRA
jgi:apolipoprotein N-acyltransferase